MKHFLSLLAGPLLAGACATTPTPTSTPAGAAVERLQITELIARFTDAASRRDFATMPELFVEDAVWEADAEGLGFRHHGRDEIRRWLTDNPNRVEVVFYLAVPTVVELDGPDHARTRTLMTELLRKLDTGEHLQLFGTYDDELVRRDGRWQFARRRFQLAYLRPLP